MPRNDKGDEGARMGGVGCLVEGPYSRLRGNDKGENCGNDKEKKRKSMSSWGASTMMARVFV